MANSYEKPFYLKIHQAIGSLRIFFHFKSVLKSWTLVTFETVVLGIKDIDGAHLRSRFPTLLTPVDYEKVGHRRPHNFWGFLDVRFLRRWDEAIGTLPRPPEHSALMAVGDATTATIRAEGAHVILLLAASLVFPHTFKITGECHELKYNQTQRIRITEKWEKPYRSDSASFSATENTTYEV